ncbi:hypothetical protein ZIOFF_067578 [Zingiber officinale]|uniref:Cysteine proteinase inhibitor n=1 Tax=Zingiber officinale TaxID=94328 RepID=A0A8J5CFW9_ZINOF|nr:hypothetical protein ZIOFF_067578 [Zingiber officinale]
MKTTRGKGDTEFHQSDEDDQIVPFRNLTAALFPLSLSIFAANSKDLERDLLEIFTSSFPLVFPFVCCVIDDLELAWLVHCRSELFGILYVIRNLLPFLLSTTILRLAVIFVKLQKLLSVASYSILLVSVMKERIAIALGFGLNDSIGVQSTSISDITLSKLSARVLPLKQDKKTRLQKSSLFDHVTCNISATVDEVSAPGAVALDLIEQLLKAKEQVVASKMYYLTLEANDCGSKKQYEAKVWVKPWMNFMELEDFKPLTDSPSTSSQDKKQLEQSSEGEKKESAGAPSENRILKKKKSKKEKSSKE